MTRPSCSEGVDVTVWINRGVRHFWRGALLFFRPRLRGPVPAVSLKHGGDMRHLRRHRDFLAWLMSVAVSCNIILAMVCCAPIGGAHGSQWADGDAFGSALCTSGALKNPNWDGQRVPSHTSLHSDCVLCSHAPGSGNLASAGPGEFALPGFDTSQQLAFPPEAQRAASHFAFAEPMSRGPPRA